jgi:ABC-type sulfate transport system permease component
MEASMHGSFDRSPEAEKTIYRRWGIGFLALPVLLATVLIALAFTQPGALNLISEAAQAEFANAYLGPEIAPTQIAQPKEIRTVRAN